MDARNYELIDRYLRKEMSLEESLFFEQEALNNAELRLETELTFRIKRCLADRQLKLRRIAQWECERKIKNVGSSTACSLAALIALGFFVAKPLLSTNGADMDMPVVSLAETSGDRKEMCETAIAAVRCSMSEGREEDAVAEVNRLEKQDVIPTLNDVSEGKFVMNCSGKAEDADALSRDAYELHWLKIKSLIAIGKTEDAVVFLRAFVRVEGKYSAEADSLLHALE